MTTPANITIAINDAAYNYPSPTDGDWAGLNAVWERDVANLPLGEGQDKDTPPADRPGYASVSAPELWLQGVIEAWIASPQGSNDPDAITATIARAIKSWSTDPAPVPEAGPETPPEPTPTVNSVPIKAAKLWLIRALRQLGVKDAFDAWLATQSSDIQEDFAACTEIKRADPITAAAKLPPLSLTDEQLDQIWILADTLMRAA